MADIDYATGLGPDSALRGRWALILGASSGFGAATAVELARAGMNIFGVHLDRKATMANVESIVAGIRGAGCEAVFFNMNAADPDKRSEAAKAMAEKLGEGGRVTTMLHSLAFGSLLPFVAAEPAGETLTRAQVDMTLDVMANSLVYWVQELMKNRLLGEGSRVFAMTSSGGRRVFPSYGAVSAAKAALESHIRQLAMELGKFGITANAIRAGVTDTPALRKIPGHEFMLSEANRKNPGGRLTTPEDVAKAVAVLSLPGTSWVTGNVIGVDGGEDIVD